MVLKKVKAFWVLLQNTMPVVTLVNLDVVHPQMVAVVGIAIMLVAVAAQTAITAAPGKWVMAPPTPATAAGITPGTSTMEQMMLVHLYRAILPAALGVDEVDTPMLTTMPMLQLILQEMQPGTV
jgi:hypothetical protein